MNLPKSTPVQDQTLQSQKAIIDEDGYEVGLFRVKIRYDDSCNNGHNTFSIVVTSHGNTGAPFEPSALHSSYSSPGFSRETSAILIAHFPKLHKYLKWHLCSSDGPMHYLANTIYHAQDLDCNGKRKGEVTFGNLEVHINQNVVYEKDIHQYDWQADYYHGLYLPVTMATKLAIEEAYDLKMTSRLDEFEREHGMLFAVKRRVIFRSEGKEPNLEGARRTAIWPDGTLEQLACKETLEARLPGLMEEFKRDMQELFGESCDY